MTATRKLYQFHVRKRSATALSILILAATVSVFGCRRPSVVHTDDGVLVLGKFEETATMQRGVTVGSRTLVIESETGGVTITGSSSSEAVLNFSITGRGDSRDAAQAQIDKLVIEESGDEASYSYNVIPDKAALTTINIDGQIPRNASLRLLLRNGDVTVTNVDGTIEVRQENGSLVYLGGGESVNLSTNNGDVFADFYRVSAGSRVDVNVDNGDISLGVPETANLALDARTRAGSVTVHDLRFVDERLGRSGAGAVFKGKLGNGAATVYLKTTNGSLTFNKVDLSEVSPPPIPTPMPADEPSDSLDVNETDAPIDSTSGVEEGESGGAQADTMSTASETPSIDAPPNTPVDSLDAATF